MILSAWKRVSLKETLEFEFNEVSQAKVDNDSENHDRLVGIDARWNHEHLVTITRRSTSHKP